MSLIISTLKFHHSSPRSYRFWLNYIHFLSLRVVGGRDLKIESRLKSLTFIRLYGKFLNILIK